MPLPPLIITACDPALDTSRDEPQPRSNVAAIVESICQSGQAGAAISHHHGVNTYSPDRGYELNEADTNETVRQVRANSDIIIQMGGPIAVMMGSSQGRDNLGRLWKDASIDQVSVLTNHMEFVATGLARTNSRDSLREAIEFCHEEGVRPEFEVWQVGDVWNLRWALDQAGAKPPYWVELLHGGEGSAWSPAILEETLLRADHLPEGSLWHVNAYTPPKGRLTPEEHSRFLAQVIAQGGHVRIGREDRPELRTGVPATNNASLVEHIADIGRALGREIATPSRAREMLGLPR
jgi:uncharacterized protein (DUF849 family)